MNVVYARETPGDSARPWIFLAGPTPRHTQPDVKSWRPKAIDFFRSQEFNGTLFVPENREGIPFNEDDYDEQVPWEWDSLDSADVIMFWVPRELGTLPGFTTNVEFGMYAGGGNVVFGAPLDAQKNGYLERLAERYHIPMAATLAFTVAQAIDMSDGGMLETEGDDESCPCGASKRCGDCGRWIRAGYHYCENNLYQACPTCHHVIICDEDGVIAPHHCVRPGWKLSLPDTV